MTDIADTLAPKSDQLNADDLIAGPLTVRIVGVSRGDAEQPVVVKLDGLRPYKPCKAMRRILAHFWGTDADAWVGRSLTLYRDPEVKWAGETVGGIRISHLSDIKGDERVPVTTSRGQRKAVMFRRLDPPRKQQAAPTLAEVLAGAGLTVADLDGYVVSQGKPATSSLDARKQQATADKLAASPDALAAVRVWVEQQQAAAPPADTEATIPPPADDEF